MYSTLVKTYQKFMDTKMKNQEFTAILWDLFLISVGMLIFTIGAKAILAHHQFITGGIYGTALLLSRLLGVMSSGYWYLVLNVPLLWIGYKYFSMRFFLYTTYAIILTTFLLEVIEMNFGIEDQLYAAIASGVICGVGAGMIFRSRGSSGGLDIVALFLNRKFNIGIGKFFLAFNALLFLCLATQYKPDVVIASIILTFTSSVMMDQVITLFNQRKIVYILSDKHEEIVRAITVEMKIGATLINAQGAYSGNPKKMVMTITNNLQLKKLEDTVFNIDEYALFIAENSFNVLGANIGKRKMY